MSLRVALDRDEAGGPPRSRSSPLRIGRGPMLPADAPAHLVAGLASEPLAEVLAAASRSPSAWKALARMNKARVGASGSFRARVRSAGGARGSPSPAGRWRG